MNDSRISCSRILSRILCPMSARVSSVIRSGIGGRDRPAAERRPAGSGGGWSRRGFRHPEFTRSGERVQRRTRSSAGQRRGERHRGPGDHDPLVLNYCAFRKGSALPGSGPLPGRHRLSRHRAGRLVPRILTDPGGSSFIQSGVGSTVVTPCGAEMRAPCGSRKLTEEERVNPTLAVSNCRVCKDVR